LWKEEIQWQTAAANERWLKKNYDGNGRVKWSGWMGRLGGVEKFLISFSSSIQFCVLKYIYG